ncbi:glutathione synthetase, chloroplastic [Olea europaea subsp. europaea]|uniref:Glutathione synthetase, chloroplastic n=1 Tax=Olea europaea subsp. europaea TaxID=158383 RepID=A0A8S0TZ54_OLEEU|nr:glutathione synthetase, chloroplastic [Olea europaea subsp. europaea]
MMHSYGVPFMGFFLETGIDRDQEECLAWAWFMPHFLFLPMPFRESHWKQVCQIAPIFNELVDRVSLNGKFLQDSLSWLNYSTKKVDDFTYRLLENHSKMLDAKKIEEIRLGLHRSDYMLDEQTKLLLQIEHNTISISSFAQGCLVRELHRPLSYEVLDNEFSSRLKHKYVLSLFTTRHWIPQNSAVTQFAEALSKASSEYNNPRAVVIVVVQTEERNMYDQQWLCKTLKERYPF